MKRNLKTWILLLCCMWGAVVTLSAQPARKGYCPVNGLKMYYEVYGQGKPLVLLHGAFMTINLNYSELIPELAKNRMVIALEFQGHGRTADIDRAFSMQDFADDVSGLLDFLKIDSADVIGYSLGGGVALQLGIRHPKQVRKLVILSSPFKFEGWSPESRAVFAMLKPEFFEGSPLKKAYDSLAPDPKGWPVLVEKILQSIQKPYDFTEGVKGIKSPIEIILGDSDGILKTHAAEMFTIIGGGQNGDMQGIPASRFAVLPGTSHTGVMMCTNWLLTMIVPFLDGTQENRAH